MVGKRSREPLASQEAFWPENDKEINWLTKRYEKLLVQKETQGHVVASGEVLSKISKSYKERY